MAGVRALGLKPCVDQKEDPFLVRIRQKGYSSLQMTVSSRAAAENLVKKVEEERSRGLFLDYTKSLKISFAELMVRFLREEAPWHKSFQNAGLQAGRLAARQLATKVWVYNLAKNPMDAVRRPKYSNERERRINADEERAPALAERRQLPIRCSRLNQTKINFKARNTRSQRFEEQVEAVSGT